MKTRLALTFRRNTACFTAMLKECGDEIFQLKTGESNSIGWITGHMILYRGKIVERLKKISVIEETERKFERGAEKKNKDEIDFEKALKEFSCRGEEIASAIDRLTDEQLNTILDIEIPGEIPDLANYLSRLAWHETFHLGQIDLIKAASGKGGIK
jgi:uncharacterized damage-inducible protein DinB